MPILLVADTQGELPFPLFKGVRGDLRYLDPKKSFAHESYTSAYLLRLRGECRINSTRCGKLAGSGTCV
jgi:hypothetical protein